MIAGSRRGGPAGSRTDFVVLPWPVVAEARRGGPPGSRAILIIYSATGSLAVVLRDRGGASGDAAVVLRDRGRLLGRVVPHWGLQASPRWSFGIAGDVAVVPRDRGRLLNSRSIFPDRGPVAVVLRDRGRFPTGLRWSPPFLDGLRPSGRGGNAGCYSRVGKGDFSFFGRSLFGALAKDSGTGTSPTAWLRHSRQVGGLSDLRDRSPMYGLF